ncbi:SAM-dependent methyltransferase [Paenibacillus anaericanus]|uniref:methyltransferase n=1 Tax=Paenibacillus anaericanus TaxID=170367 RepID=UPI0027811D74|nr:methyltransferase [Paenibacillus anaericanus]MDQ0089967.1 SAM-dependent methyltransferase [Paenibacillus anaericanus]
MVAKLNLDYYVPSNDDIYSDGDIEKELLQYSNIAEYDWYNDGRWPVVYHMSHLRHNILNWFPFKPNCSILEIGAGCGALTGLLCQHAASVVAVELTKRRGEVNFQRHQHYDNLEIVICDFQSIPNEWKFDYIIINGVLEYAAYMIEGNHPYEDFLRISAEHLNDKGRILLAIENRLGLKYFSGAKEDHTGKYFSGINGYVDGEKVRTFSKEELCEQISKANLHALKFYYPYPDYKFPAEIFTDNTVNTLTPSVPNYPMDMSRTKLFDERNAYQSLMKLNIMDKFSNSFLVEIAPNSNETPADISYVKLSANRKVDFRICTYFDVNKQCVYKKALSLQGEEHLGNMKRFGGFDYFNASIKNIPCENESKGLSYPFITGVSLEDTLIDAYGKGNLDKFISIFKHFRDALYADIPPQRQPISTKFEEIFGVSQCKQSLRWATNPNIDMISGNIFIENEYQVIDYEWHVPCKLPQEFVLWRMLNQLVDDHALENFLTKPVIYSLISINEHTEQCFLEWEAHFAKEYVGIRDLSNLAQDVVTLDVEKAATQILKENTVMSTLFFDTGSGFTGTNYERHTANSASDGFTVTFSNEMLNKAKVLRWDPLEGTPCWIKIQRIETDGIISNINPINAERYLEDKGYEFFTFDPQIEIIGDFNNATFLQVHFTCDILEWTQGYHKREEELNLSRQQLAEQTLMNRQLIEEVQQYKVLVHELQNDFKEVQQDSLRLKDHLDSKLAQLSTVQIELASSQEELHDIQNNLNKTRSALQDTQNDLQKTQNNLRYITDQAKEHRFKTILKVLMYGDITRGTSGE